MNEEHGFLVEYGYKIVYIDGDKEYEFIPMYYQCSNVKYIVNRWTERTEQLGPFAVFECPTFAKRALQQIADRLPIRSMFRYCIFKCQFIRSAEKMVYYNYFNPATYEFYRAESLSLHDMNQIIPGTVLADKVKLIEPAEDLNKIIIMEKTA